MSTYFNICSSPEYVSDTLEDNVFESDSEQGKTTPHLITTTHSTTTFNLDATARGAKRPRSPSPYEGPSFKERRRTVNKLLDFCDKAADFLNISLTGDKEENMEDPRAVINNLQETGSDPTAQEEPENLQTTQEASLQSFEVIQREEETTLGEDTGMGNVSPIISPDFDPEQGKIHNAA